MSEADDLPIRVPDGIQPIVAYRAWHVEERRGRIVLKGAAYRATWEPGGWSRAECFANNHPRHRGRSSGGETPSEGCTCGFYAVKELSAIPGPILGGWDRSVLVGKVELAGKVIEHDRGYRAERARVVELLPAPGQEALAERAAATYGVPVSNELIEAFPELEPVFRFAGPSPGRAGWAGGGRGTVGRPAQAMLGWGSLVAQILLILSVRASSAALMTHAGLAFAIIPSLVLVLALRWVFDPNLRRFRPWSSITRWIRSRGSP